MAIDPNDLEFTTTPGPNRTTNFLSPVITPRPTNQPTTETRPVSVFNPASPPERTGSDPFVTQPGLTLDEYLLNETITGGTSAAAEAVAEGLPDPSSFSSTNAGSSGGSTTRIPGPESPCPLPAGGHAITQGTTTTLPPAQNPYEYELIDPFDDRYDFRLGEKVRDIGINGTASFANTPIPGVPGNGSSGVYTPGLSSPEGGTGQSPTSPPTGENGRLDPSTLTSIGSGHRLRDDAAQAYLRMVEAAAADGISWTITDSYRSYEAQVDVARRKGLYSQGGLAARPGTSNHGWGLAVDLGGGANSNGTPQNNWLRQNAGRFGFSTIAREPWHWEYGG